MANDDDDLEVKATGAWDYINENKKAKDIFLWIWHNFLSQKGKEIALWMLFLVLLGGITGVVTAYAVKIMIDSAVNELTVKGVSDFNIPEGFWLLTLLVIGGRVLGAIKNYIQEYFFADFHERLNHGVSKLFYGKSLGLHVSENTVLNADNIKKGTDRCPDLTHNIVVELPYMVLAVLLPFIFLIPIDLKITMLMILVMVIHLGSSGYLNYVAMIEGYPIEKMWRALYRYRVERWRHIERVKNNAKESCELSMLQELYDEASTRDLKLWKKFVVLSFIRGVICAAITLVAILYGLYEIRQGLLSIGYIFPLISFTLQILDNLWRIGDLERKIHYNLHSVGILKEALSMSSGITVLSGALKLPEKSPCRIEFDSVSYRFKNDNTAPVLNGISFTIEPKERTAIIGISGVGKSTLMKLLLRYVDPTAGSIRIDGQDLREIDLASWLDMVGYIPQQPQILNGTVGYNGKYNVPSRLIDHITDEYVWEQMRMLQGDFGERLTHGLNTRLGYNGIELSGGQNQRLMILAAAMKKPNFMIIDEATSSLDSSTEKLVQAGLEKVLTDCGALIVAHRLSTVGRICNKFIVIDQVNGSGGQIVGMAHTLQELYETCPQFRKLADDQELKI